MRLLGNFRLAFISKFTSKLPKNFVSFLAVFIFLFFSEAALRAVPFAQILPSYLAIQESLSLDQFEEAQVQAKKLLAELKGSPTVSSDSCKAKKPKKKKNKKLSQKETAQSGMCLSQPVSAASAQDKEQEELLKATQNLLAATDMANFRVGFKVLSEKMIELKEKVGATGLQKVYCSMAGASWLEKKNEKGDVNNPYYGQQMLRCGEIK